jgi:hypothetical protein
VPAQLNNCATVHVHVHVHVRVPVPASVPVHVPVPRCHGAMAAHSSTVTKDMCVCVGVAQAARTHAPELEAAFARLRDTGGPAGTGVTAASLAQAARDLGEPLSVEDVRIMMAAADKDGDGIVSREEFMRAMYKAMSAQ